MTSQSTVLALQEKLYQVPMGKLVKVAPLLEKVLDLLLDSEQSLVGEMNNQKIDISTTIFMMPSCSLGSTCIEVPDLIPKIYNSCWEPPTKSMKPSCCSPCGPSELPAAVAAFEGFLSQELKNWLQHPPSQSIQAASLLLLLHPIFQQVAPLQHSSVKKWKLNAETHPPSPWSQAAAVHHLHRKYHQLDPLKKSSVKTWKSFILLCLAHLTPRHCCEAVSTGSSPPGLKSLILLCFLTKQYIFNQPSYPV